MTTMSYNAALVMMEVHRQQVPHGELSPNLVKTIADEIHVSLTSEEVVYISDHAWSSCVAGVRVYTVCTYTVRRKRYHARWYPYTR